MLKHYAAATCWRRGWGLSICILGITIINRRNQRHTTKNCTLLQNQPSLFASSFLLRDARRFWLLCTALCLCLFHLRAQVTEPRINIRLIGPDEGLLDRDARCIAQDSLGFLWVSTSSKLWRYDGYSFQNLTGLLTRTSGYITFINDVQKSPDNKIWVAHNNGISIINPTALTCASVDVSRPFPSQLSSKLAIKIHFTKNGQTWVALPGNNVVKTDERGKPLRLLTLPEGNTMAPFANRFINKFFQDNNQNGYLFSGTDFIDVVDKEGRFKQRIDLLNDTLRNSGFYAASAVTQGPDSLAIFYSRLNKKQTMVRNFALTRHAFSPLTQNRFVINPEYRYFSDKSLVWYKSDREVGFLNTTTGTFSNLTKELQQQAGVQTYFYNALVGSDKTFWLCSGAGLFKINGTEQLFQKYLDIPLQKPTDVGTSMRGLTEDSAGNIWASSYGFIKDSNTFTLHKLAPKEGKLEHLGLILEKTTYPYVLYKSLFLKNFLYAVTDGTVLLRINPRSLAFEAFTYPSVTGNQFTTIYARNDSMLWMGALSGMLVMNPGKPGLVSLNNEPGNYIKNIRVNHFMPWSGGRVLASTSNGLYVLDGSATIVEHYGNNAGDKIRLPFLRIYYTTWYRNRLWVSSSEGLMCVDTTTKKVQTFTAKEGLPNDNVYAALPDERGNLWLSTNHGLCRFDVATRKARNYGLADGLPQLEFNNASFLKAHDGTLYFGGLNGIVAFDPARLDTAKEEETALRLVAYSKYTANNSDLQTIDGNAVEDKIVFGAGDRLFQFSFMSPDYRNTEQNRFRYKLEGWSKGDWRLFETGNKLSFNSLPPGDYTLRVQVSAAGTDWSTKEWKAHLVVQAPWYNTWWFYTASLLLVAAIAYVAYRYRVAQILRIQQIRNRISADMHDEIGSTLSSITFYSQALLMQTTEPKHKDVLQKIKENAQQVQEGLSDIIWSVKASMDQIENVYARMFSFGTDLLESRGIRFHFEADENLKHEQLDMAGRKNFYLIFKEAVNNAAKYATCENIWVRIGPAGHQVKMVVQDDGKGFDPATAKRGNGLANMQQRATQMKGALTVR